MNWNDWSDFFAMGGYALYVWGALAVVAAAMAGEVALIAARRRTCSRHGDMASMATERAYEIQS